MYFYGFQNFYEISMGLFLYFSEMIGKNIAWDFGSGISRRFQLGFQHLCPRFQLVAEPSCMAVVTFVHLSRLQH